jgi:hypothetical protein
MITLLNNEFVKLVYYPETKILSHTLKTKVVGAILRELFNTGHQAMVTYEATKWLSDDRNFPVLSISDERWAQTDWFPRVRDAGWKHWALVRNNANQTAKAALTKGYATLGINAQLFSDVEQAMQWLILQ